MIKELLAVVFVIIAALFFYGEASSVVDPTTSTFSVNENWSDYGTVDNLVANDIMYVDGTNDSGSWTSFIQEEDRSRVIDFELVGDPRNGNVNFTINMWSGAVEGDPDNSESFELDSTSLEETVEDARNFDYFEFVIDIEDEGSTDTRPNVESLEVDFERDGGPGVPELLLAIMILGSFTVFLKRF